MSFARWIGLCLLVVGFCLWVIFHGDAEWLQDTWFADIQVSNTQ
jgi:hypothetical protein